MRAPLQFTLSLDLGFKLRTCSRGTLVAVDNGFDILFNKFGSLSSEFFVTYSFYSSFRFQQILCNRV